MTVTVSVTYRPSSEDLTTCVIVADGITIKSGKQTAFGPTEITTCSFVANRNLLKTAAWRLVTRTTQDIQVTINGSVRFTGWWWRSEEDIFDERGFIQITLASTVLKNIIEDSRELRFSTRITPYLSSSGLIGYTPVDPGLVSLGRLVDDQGSVTFAVTTSNFSDDPSGISPIQDPPSNIPQLRTGERNTYTTDARLSMRMNTPQAPPFTVAWVMNASPASIKAAALSRPFAVWTDNMSFRFGVSSTGLVSVLIRNELTNTALLSTSVAWASRNTQAGELWLFVLGVEAIAANVSTTLTVYPLSRAEGNLANLEGTALVGDLSAAPAAGIGSLDHVEWGPLQSGLFAPDDLLLSDLLVFSLVGVDPEAIRVRLLSGLRSDNLLTGWAEYFDTGSTVTSNGTYTVLAPTVPSGTGADQLAAIEEIHRTVIRANRSAEFSLNRTSEDYVPVSVTELAIADDYLRNSGSAGEEGELTIAVPDGNYPLAVDAFGADWQRNRSRKWARVPVNLDSTDKRAVDVGNSYVSFYTRPGNIWRGRVVGIEETVDAALHTAFWVLEEWPHKGQLQADSAVAVGADGSPKAASVNATYSGGGSLTVDATYSAYDLPFTVRPAAASKYKLVISGVSGTTWTINTGASSLPPSMAVGDLLNFDNAAIAY